MAIKKILCLVLFAHLTNCSFSSSNKDPLEQRLDQLVKELDAIRTKDSLQRRAEADSIKLALERMALKGSVDLSAMYESLRRSVFVVYTTDGYTESQGSAFLVGTDGTCVSNYHVFNGSQRAVVKNMEGELFEVLEMIAVNEQHDYVLFKIDLKNRLLQPLILSLESPKVGDPTFAIGNPRGLEQTLSSGIISGFRDDSRLIQTTTEITYGSSGGPLFNARGHVIGITTSGLNEANLNFAINIALIPFEQSFAGSSEILAEPFKVSSLRAYLFKDLKYETKSFTHLKRGDQGVVLEQTEQYSYIRFIDKNGSIITGWIRNYDIESPPSP